MLCVRCSTPVRYISIFDSQSIWSKPVHETPTQKHSHLGLKQKVDVPGEPRKIYFGYIYFRLRCIQGLGSFFWVCLFKRPYNLPGEPQQVETWAIFRPRRLFIFYRAWGAFFRQRYVSEIIISSPPQPHLEEAPQALLLVKGEKGRGVSLNKSLEQELNLSRSWHKGHSHAYNTPFLFKSSTKDLSPPIFELVFSISNAVQWYDLGHARGRSYFYSW